MTIDRRSVLAGAGALGLAGLSGVARAQGAAKPPVARTVGVVDERFGIRLPDPYRWMENPKDPDWEPFMRGQGAYARQVLDGLPGRAALAKRIGALSGDLPVAAQVQRVGGKTFVQYRPAGANSYKLYVIDRADGERRLLIDPEAEKDASGAHRSLDWWVASPEGAHVIFGTSPAGSENSVARVMKVADGALLPESFDRAQYSQPNWLPDGSGFFLTRGREGAVLGAPDYYLNSVSWFHRLGSDPKGDVRIVSGGDALDGYTLTPIDFPFVFTTPGSDMAVMIGYGGVRRENPLWTAPLADAAAGRARWRRAALIEDSVTSFALRGRELYVVSEKGAPLGRLLRMDAAAPDLGRAEVMIPEGRMPIENVAAARDAIYVQRMDGGPQRLQRLGADGGLADIAMPFDAGIYGIFASTDADGIDVRMSGWTTSPGIWRYEPATGRMADTGLSPKPAFDTSPYESFRIIATAKDGTKVPVSVIARKGLKRDGTAPVLAQCYSSYQISASPLFAARNIPFLDAGGVMAEVHARGGGEYGRPWWEGGRKATKANTWNDFIAGCEALIAERITAPGRLTIMGTSAGGIAVGRALTTRPDLFAGAVVNVGWLNNTRGEAEQNNAPNIPEFGDPKIEADFKAIHAMDSYQHVVDGTRYPGVLIITGLTDPRVAPWHGAKFAARLQKASAGGAPVLLRVDAEAGHGLGSTRAQTDELSADVFAFTLWRARGTA